MKNDEEDEYLKWKNGKKIIIKIERKIINKKVVKLLKYQVFFYSQLLPPSRPLLGNNFFYRRHFRKTSFALLRTFLSFSFARHVCLLLQTTKGNYTLEIQTWYRKRKQSERRTIFMVNSRRLEGSLKVDRRYLWRWKMIKGESTFQVYVSEKSFSVSFHWNFCLVHLLKALLLVLLLKIKINIF